MILNSGINIYPFADPLQFVNCDVDFETEQEGQIKTRKFPCRQCPANHFQSKNELKGHIKSVHEEKELYICAICNDWRPNIVSMKTHIVVEHDKPDLLNSKPKEFLKLNLIRKLEQSQSCDQCGEKFGNKRELKGHVLSVHEGRKVYECSLCRKPFFSCSKLKNHLIAGHGQKNIEKPRVSKRPN